ncbi:Type IV secretory pathway, VirD4 component [Hoeflea phototrophica DFL-43]|jgi:hypothetical protein|uniref:Type IV secretory pathway, VirD4 component n=1 Tax=Hoeflea phototrophica (strain DSM 17068 / NCIMB 14078 / DFL-43) TaxID=411684 RepID=A9DHU8_HOEPD|nr:TraM recognition domain-containing protein [Hoeflea phototrophica]EDQ31390.2 Type IV secretory pathway, VirD4 component [Hoeflea phototrophica DFL-43]
MGHISYSRGYGVANIFVLQNDTAFEKTYGKGSFETLWNNCEIVLALPGQRGSSVLSLLEKFAGRTSYVAENKSGNTAYAEDGFSRASFSEDGKPVFDADEIRRTKKGLLFLRGNFPLQVDVAAYAAIDPIRDVAEINPFHGKPFLQPVQTWFKASPNWPLKRIALTLKRFWKRTFHRHLCVDPAIRKRRLERRAMIFKALAALCSLWWIFALGYLYLYTNILHRLAGSLVGGL